MPDPVVVLSREPQVGGEPSVVGEQAICSEPMRTAEISAAGHYVPGASALVEKTRARDPAYKPTRIPLRPCSHPLQGGAKLMSVGAPNC
jgi:hypothetical protein